MNKIIRTTILFIFLLLYSFATSYYSGNLACSNLSSTSCRHSDTESQYLLNSKNLFCHTTQYKTSVNAVNNVSSSSSKNSFLDFFANLKASEHTFLNRFQQYILFSKKILLGFRQTDIIFPFHYFW
jgi:hypothetical protein